MRRRTFIAGLDSAAAWHVIEWGLSPRYLVEFARAHDEAGFDLALVGYSSSSAEGFLIALHAAATVRFLRAVLSGQRRGFGYSPPPEAASPLLRRRFARRARHGRGWCDVYAIYAEHLASTRERVAQFPGGRIRTRAGIRPPYATTSGAGEAVPPSE